IVESTAGTLAGILGRLIVDGQDAVQTTSNTITNAPSSDPTSYHNLDDADLVDYFLTHKLMVVQGASSLGSIAGIPYYQGISASVLCIAGSTCPADAVLPAGWHVGDIEVEAGIIDAASVNHGTTTVTTTGIVDPSITVSDPVSATIGGASVRISKGLVD